MKKTLKMPDEVWTILEPLLGKYVIKPEEIIEDSTPIDIQGLIHIPCGVRIANILRDGRWSEKYSKIGSTHRGDPLYGITTIGQLRSIKRNEFLKHRNAGARSWKALQEYIHNL